MDRHAIAIELRYGFAGTRDRRAASYVRNGHRARRPDVRRPRRAGVRFPRAERRGQDHRDARRLRRDGPGRRRDPLARPPGRRGGPPHLRLHARGARALPGHGAGRPGGVLRAAARHGRPGRRARRQPLDRPPRPVRPGEDADRRAVARQPAARPARRRARPRSRAARARRAVLRARPRRHRRHELHPRRARRGRRHRAVLQPPARPRGGHLRGGGDHPPRPPRRVRAGRGPAPRRPPPARRPGDGRPGRGLVGRAQLRRRARWTRYGRMARQRYP